MTITHEQRFLARIKSALDVSTNSDRKFTTLFPGQSEEEARQLVKQITTRKKDAQQRLLDQLIEAGKPINLNVMPMADMATATETITDLVIKKKPEWGREKHVSVWRHPLIDKLNLPHALADKKIPVPPYSLSGQISQTEGSPKGSR